MDSWAFKGYRDGFLEMLKEAAVPESGMGNVGKTQPQSSAPAPKAPVAPPKRGPGFPVPPGMGGDPSGWRGPRLQAGPPGLPDRAGLDQEAAPIPEYPSSRESGPVGRWPTPYRRLERDPSRATVDHKKIPNRTLDNGASFPFYSHRSPKARGISNSLLTLNRRARVASARALSSLIRGGLERTGDWFGDAQDASRGTGRALANVARNWWRGR